MVRAAHVASRVRRCEVDLIETELADVLARFIE
jgi:hypothetical protein